MKSFNTVVLIFMIGVVACSDDSGSPALDIWGISISNKDRIKNSNGEIVNQNNGPLKAYEVDSAYVQGYLDDLYIFKLYFATSDSLCFVLSRGDGDFNYHSDAEPLRNKILHAMFNTDTLEMKPTAIAIQPRQEYNSFHAVTNLHTKNSGTFNGTVNEVPLIN